MAYFLPYATLCSRVAKVLKHYGMLDFVMFFLYFTQSGCGPLGCRAALNVLVSGTVGSGGPLILKFKWVTPTQLAALARLADQPMRFKSEDSSRIADQTIDSPLKIIKTVVERAARGASDKHLTWFHITIDLNEEVFMSGAKPFGLPRAYLDQIWDILGLFPKSMEDKTLYFVPNAQPKS